MLVRSLATLAVVGAVLLVTVGGPKLGRAGSRPATPLVIDGNLGVRVAALETRVATLEAHLGTLQGVPALDVSLPSTPMVPAVTNDARVTEVIIKGYDIGWTPEAVTVLPGMRVTLVNTGTAGHNFEVRELGINLDMPVGETVETTIPPHAQPGTYTFICNIPGHARAGMLGELIVQEIPVAPVASVPTPTQDVP